MIKMSAELAALESETFEIAEIADVDSAFASAEVPVFDAAPCSCMCSTGCTHWTSTSTSCSSTS
ncbi:hypothetical protein GCM10009555_046310 [Acrocarpospora macrocephala]|uniref:Thiazolylpeptide-type bacteriocin n=1 Tax=Acrocarpospora macrocephala TaxID=150177 RepID=A0A5M3WSV7_9ACTN|nr:hypothetical protein [Acrocarpospora macrocephala]GES11974.1 hypothetical protein Amac_055710 [Acrocarpospora macrocephala]